MIRVNGSKTNVGRQLLVKNNKGWTPLHIAAWNGSKEMFEILILNGADINLKNNRGKTPLDYTTKSMIDSLNKETKEILDKTKKISELSKINNAIDVQLINLDNTMESYLKYLRLYLKKRRSFTKLSK